MKIYKIAKRKLDDFKEEVIQDALVAFIKSTQGDWNYITPEQLHRRKKSQYYLLDVRKPEAFRSGHIKGAKNIFWMDILKPENLRKLPKNKKIVVICYVGHTASQVVVMLRLLGYKAAGLKYGMGISPVEGIPVAGWTDFGFKTVKS